MGLLCCVLAVFTAVCPDAARSQNINRTVDFEDFGFSVPLSVGARPAGLAGAYVAAGNDVYALCYNPAGLARITSPARYR